MHLERAHVFPKGMFRTPAITHAQTGEWPGTGSAEGVERSATSNSDTNSNDICADVLKHDDIFGAISGYVDTRTRVEKVT